MSNDLYTSAYNPDVLSCIANLSNDEVFTPPEVANAMLESAAAGTVSAIRTPRFSTRPANPACFCGKLPSGCWWGWSR